MNYNKYECSTGDRIDLVVLKHYGSLERLNEVIAENKHLFKESMNLTAGTFIQLPIFPEETVQENVSKIREPLW